MLVIQLTPVRELNLGGDVLATNQTTSFYQHRHRKEHNHGGEYHRHQPSLRTTTPPTHPNQNTSVPKNYLLTETPQLEFQIKFLRSVLSILYQLSTWSPLRLTCQWKSASLQRVNLANVLPTSTVVSKVAIHLVYVTLAMTFRHMCEHVVSSLASVGMRQTNR